MQAILSLFERIIHVQLYGKINTRMVQNLKEGLHRKNLYSVQLIAVSINSQGGSLTQAKNINSVLRKFSQQTRAPIYTFAEDFSLNAANVILTGGNKCFANQHSIIGEHGFFYRSFGYKALIQEHNLQAEYIAQGKNKVKINPFEDVTPDGSKWIQNVLDEMEYELKAEVIKNREGAFQKLKLTSESIEKDIFQKPIITSDEALKVGFIDGISTMEKVVSEKIGHIKQIDVMKQGFFDERLRFVPEKIITDL